jgi:DNA-binding Xre family transcriptional regulator
VRCFTRIDRISAYERGVRAPDLIALLLLGDPLGVSAGDLTEGLVAPLRRTGTAQLLALVTRQPGPSTEAGATSLECHSGTQARSPATSSPQEQSHRSSRLNRRPWVVPIVNYESDDRPSYSPNRPISVAGRISHGVRKPADGLLRRGLREDRCREAPASNTGVNCASAGIADGEPVTVIVGYFDLLVAAGLKDARGRDHRVRIPASDLKECRSSNGARARKRFERSTTRMFEGMGRSMTSSKPSRGRLASRRDHEHMASSVITALLMARVDELRRPRALSLERLAFASDVSWWTLQRLRSELSDPRLSALLRLCRGLGVTAGQLLDDLPLPVEPRPSYARTPAQAGTDT